MESDGDRNEWNLRVGLLYEDVDLPSDDRIINVDWENFYNQDYLRELVNSDCIDPEEEAFVRGYENI